MAAPFIIPFNNQPVTTTVKTAAYTVPAGKYARVRGYFITEFEALNVATTTLPSLTIDGTSVFWVNNYRFRRTTSGTTTAVFTNPVQFGGYCFGSLNATNSTGGTSSLVVQLSGFNVSPTTSLTTGTSGNTFFESSVSGGGVFTFPNASATFTWTGTIHFKNEGPKNFEAWVPTGTILSGSNASTFHWLVEEFNMIS